MKEYSDAICDLLTQERFYANLLLSLNTIYTKEIPTLGISLDGSFKLFINPEFFLSASKAQRVKYLKHECLHITNNHLARAKKVTENFRKFNVAADIAINQLIHDFPDSVIVNGKEAKLATYNNLLKEVPNLISMRESEYYYEQLPKQDKGGSSGEQGQDDDMQTIDNHDWMDENVTEDEVKELLKDLLQKTAEATKSTGHSVPHEVHVTLNELGTSKVSWKRVLQNFVQSSVETRIISTRKKRNRRYDIPAPGYKTEDVLHLGVAVDTSGSVSDEELQQFMTEIKKMHETGIDITVIEADSIVRNVRKFDPKKVREFSGRGGTAYQPAIDKAKELRVDALVVLGDGDCADTPTRPKFPVLWVLVRNGSNPSSFGKVIHI